MLKFTQTKAHAKVRKKKTLLRRPHCVCSQTRAAILVFLCDEFLKTVICLPLLVEGFSCYIIFGTHVRPYLRQNHVLS